jgi:hypothetical protein
MLKGLLQNHIQELFLGHGAAQGLMDLVQQAKTIQGAFELLVARGHIAHQGRGPLEILHRPKDGVLPQVIASGIEEHLGLWGTKNLDHTVRELQDITGDHRTSFFYSPAIEEGAISGSQVFNQDLVAVPIESGMASGQVFVPEHQVGAGGTTDNQGVGIERMMEGLTLGSHNSELQEHDRGSLYLPVQVQRITVDCERSKSEIVILGTPRSQGGALEVLERTV